MLLALVGAAIARPSPVLAPEGPVWLGPLVDGPRMAVVDPRTGSLWVEQRGADGEVLTWDGARWLLDGTPIERLELGRERVDIEGAMLQALRDPAGGWQRFRYNDFGSLSSVEWPDGARVTVQYDDEDRVVGMQGPGTARWHFVWQEGRLDATDSMGRPLTRRLLGDDGEHLTWEVVDSLGRRVRTVEGPSGLESWTDPRGLTTTLTRRERQIEVRDGLARTWRLGLDAEGRVASVSRPGNALWSWSRDEHGRVTEIHDPEGRVTRWTRDVDGRVTAVKHMGQPRYFIRDAAGRVSEVFDAAGASTRIERDPTGAITGITDAVGNELMLLRQAGGWPAEVVSRVGGAWSVGLDLLARPDMLRDPTDRVVSLVRDVAGRLSGIDDSWYGSTTLSRGADGAITRVLDSGGRSTGFVRDGLGRVRRLLLADGSEILLDRDPAGEVSAVVMGDRVVEIKRDSLGRPLAVGDVRWTWDESGRVSSVSAPGLRYRLRRDRSGRLSGVVASGGYELSIQRDVVGRPVGWADPSGEIGVLRDPAGRVIAETGADRVEIHRDPRGFVERVDSARGAWRWLRDAAGRVLRAAGPDGLTVGIDRDDAGRPVMVRYPAGTIIHRIYEGPSVAEVVDGPSGERLVERATVMGQDGRVLRVDETGKAARLWRYDPLGAVVAIEVGDGAWSWTPDGVDGPGGERLWLDEFGRTLEARVGEGPAVWGAGTEHLSYVRDKAGRLVRVDGELGNANLAYDGLGRLDQILGSDGTVWSLDYDAWGRLVRVEPPDGNSVPLLWGPLGLLASGPQWVRTWVVGPDGLAGAAEATWEAAVVALADGDPALVVGGIDQVERVETTPQGRPLGDAAGLVGADGLIQLYPGGPRLCGSVALDPVSGQRVDGLGRWPWQPRQPRQDCALDMLDPEPWLPRALWHDPLGMLVALGELPPLDDDTWIEEVEPGPGAVPWLPASLDLIRPPLGPLPTAMPIGEPDPVSQAFLLAMLPGSEPPPADFLARTVLQSELRLPWLPPGLGVPGIEEWRDQP